MAWGGGTYIIFGHRLFCIILKKARSQNQYVVFSFKEYITVFLFSPEQWLTIINLCSSALPGEKHTLAMNQLLQQN